MFLILNLLFPSLAADQVLFNSRFNQHSFLDNIVPFMNIQSDFKIKNFRHIIEPKCKVLYFPINFHKMPNEPLSNSNELHLLWPHRWEHDKNPELLAKVLIELERRQTQFIISIIGEKFQEYPSCLNEIKEKLGHKVRNFGYLDRSKYFECLLEADVVISTADHEFYGVSM